MLASVCVPHTSRLLRTGHLRGVARAATRPLSAVPSPSEPEPREVPRLPAPSTLWGKLFKNGAQMNLPGCLFDYGPAPPLALFLRKQDWYKEAGSKVIQLDIPGSPPLVLTSDPTFYAEILGTKQKYFTNGDLFRKIFGFFFPNAIIVTEDDQWKRIRRVLKKAFDRHAVEAIIPAAAMKSEQVGRLVLDSVGPETEVDLMQVTSKMTFDSFHIFSYNWDPNTLGSEENMELLRACQVISECLAHRTLVPIEQLWKLPTPGNKTVSHALDVIRSNTDRLVEMRKRAMEAKGGQPTALLDNMIVSSEEDGGANGGGLSPQELRDNISTLFFGAYDTTSNSLVFVLDFLAKNMHVQDKLRASLQGVDVAAATPETIDGLDYLHNVFRETYRLRPTAFAFARNAKEDVVVDGYMIRKGTSIMVDHSSVGLDPYYWDGMTNLAEFEPERFERFTPKKTSSLPFGFGGRVCLGIRIAELELKTMAAHLVKNYEWTIDPSRLNEEELTVGLALGKKRALFKCRKL